MVISNYPKLQITAITVGAERQSETGTDHNAPISQITACSRLERANESRRYASTPRLENRSELPRLVVVDSNRARLGVLQIGDGQFLQHDRRVSGQEVLPLGLSH